jgi:hypothetical protein
LFFLEFFKEPEILAAKPTSVFSPCSVVNDLSEVRQLITERVRDDDLRRQLLQLAGNSPQTWKGCSRGDVVPLLKSDLAQRQQNAAIKPVPTQIPDPQGTASLVTFASAQQSPSHTAMTFTPLRPLAQISAHTLTPSMLLLTATSKLL